MFANEQSSLSEWPVRERNTHLSPIDKQSSERKVGTEFSVLSQSRQSASEETRDRVGSHSETRVLARGVYHRETPGNETQIPLRLRAMLSQRLLLDDLHARLDLRRPSVTLACARW
jgi:hypothetical protein